MAAATFWNIVPGRLRRRYSPRQIVNSTYDVRKVPSPGRNFFAVIVDGRPATVAEVTPGWPGQGEDGQPPTLQFIWTPPEGRRRGQGRAMVEFLKATYPGLSHDGNLSEDGRRLVQHFELPILPGKTFELYDPTEAEELGIRTHAKVAEAWEADAGSAR